MSRTALFFGTWFVIATFAQSADKPKDAPVALERKLQGGWIGGDCVGELTLRGDGTFERRHFSPGNNRLAGKWAVRWNAFPPTLVLACKASDDPESVGKTSEFKLVQLDDESLAYQFPDQYPNGPTVRFAREEAPVVLERTLCGTWKGGACMGELTLGADGNFERTHYTPGNNRVTGTWEMRWNALPPTLCLTYLTSDAEDRLPVGRTEALRLVHFDEAALDYQHADQYPDGFKSRYTRMTAIDLAREKAEADAETLDEELAALQGTWVPLRYEEGGKMAQGEISTRHIIQGDKVTVQVNGQTVSTGTVVLDPTQNPKHLNFQFPSGQTHSMIYVRVGDHVIYCGNRDVTWPTEFASGTPKGGEYLIAWKIER